MTYALARSRTVVAAIGFGLLAAVLFGFSAQNAAAQTGPFTTSTQIGSKGSQVTLLQQSLATNPSFYPEGLITGYFGTLTSNAVKRFQAFYGIVSAGTPATTGYGRVGPKTIAKLNEVYGSGPISTGDISAPIITSAAVTMSSTTAVATWTTNENATGRVYFSINPLQYTETMAMPVVSGNVATTDSIGRTTHSVVLTGLSANTTYNFMIVTSDMSGNVSVTWPSTFRTTNQ